MLDMSLSVEAFLFGYMLGKDTGGHVFQQQFIGMSAFELSLPQMMVGIHEARRDDFFLAVNDFRTGWRRDVCFYPCNFVILNEDICSDTLDMVIGVMNEGCASPQ